MYLHTDFWNDSFRAIQKYVEENNVEFPCDIHFFADNKPDIKGLNINPFENIKCSADKVSMNHMFDIIGVPHPITYYDPNSAPFRKIFRMFKWYIKRSRFIRKRRFSSGGNGKKVFSYFPDFDPEVHYVQEFWKHPHHVRINYLDGKPFNWCVMIGGEGDIRNHQFGWKYVPIEDVSPIETDSCFDCEIEMWAREIQNMTGLSLLAFDVALRPNDYKILEINAMPAITRFRVEPFVKELIKYAERHTSNRNKNG